MSAPLVEIPEDVDAEQRVAGLVVVNARNVAGLRAVVDPGDFYSGWVGRLLEHGDDPEIADAEAHAKRSGARLSLDVRIEMLAAAAGVEERRLRAALDALPAMSDPRGRAARRVAVVARRREIMQAGADLYNKAASGTVEDLAAVLTRAQRALAALSTSDRPRQRASTRSAP